MRSKEEKQALKARIRERIESDRAESRKIRTLSGDEKKAAVKARKEALKNEQKESREQKKFLKKVRKTRRKPVVLGIWGALALWIISSLTINYIKAVWPLSDEIKEAREAARLVAIDIQAEGSVLLLNEDDALPLIGGKINLFGTRTVTPSYGGGGSGSINSADAVSFYQALADAGIETNPELYNLYANWRYNNEISTEEYTGKDRKNYFEMVLPNLFGVLGTERYEKLDADLIPADVLANARDFSDTALMMVGSFSREAIDESKYSDKDPETLTLSEEDLKHLDLLNRNFDNVIVVINTGNVMEMGWVEDYENIKALLLVGYPGAVGFQGVAKLISGEINPSGRLTDTVPYDILSSPATDLVGHFPYENLEDQAFINYSEGIYIGYRFYESYFEGDEEGYAEAVQFPFGYGLSYTDFEWEEIGFEQNEETISLSLKVTNTGSRAGKDVVQVYYTAPYYGRGGIEKSYINLVDYAKTNELAPGESQVVTIDFSIRDMASYDDGSREAWVLEVGEYKIKLAQNVHHIVEEFTIALSDEIVYKTDDKTGTEINNLFDDARSDLEYVSRSDFDGTIKSMGDINYEAPESVQREVEYKVVPTEGEMPVFNAKNGIVLEDLKGLPYDDPQWDLFLDQFKLKEMIEMVSDGGFKSIAVKRLGVPKTLHYDGPASIRHYFGKWSTIGFPNAVTVAQTWNDELQEEMAEAMTYEGALRGIHIWYAPAMNIHRTPLGARNFEYYSEDPLISGRTAAAMVKGAHSNGLGVTLKHFALYTQETNRAGVFSWINEQALREIYLKPFEISMKEGEAYGVMSSFPRIGHKWSGANSILLNDLLREEWGFRGFVVTDITIGDHMYASESVTNGNDLMLSLGLKLKNTRIFAGGHMKNLEEAYEIDPVGIANGLRTSVKNICYMVLQTHVMNNVE